MGDEVTESIGFARRAFAQSWLYLRRDRVATLTALGVLAGLSAATDTFLTDTVGAAANVVINGLTIYLQLLLTFRMLHAHDAAPAGYTLEVKTEARLPSVIAAGVFEGIVILLGLLLLVVPGLVLMLLWSLTAPALAAERLGATDAMKRSWEIARSELAGLALIGTVFVLAVAAVILLLFSALHIAPDNRWFQIFLIDLALPAIVLGSAAVWTAAYLELRVRVQPAA